MDVTGDDIVSAFASYMRVRGFSHATVRRRVGTLAQFCRLITPKPILTATDSDIHEFLSLYESPRTRHAYRSDLAVFFKWAHRRQLIERNPCDVVDPIKVPQTLPRPVSVAQVWMLLNCAHVHDLRLMIALAAFAGLRVSEIAHLDADDVDTVRNVLVVRAGKGGKDRIIPLHPALRSIVLSQPHTPGRLVPQTKGTIGRRISEHMRDCGVDASAHKLRATFATELAEMARGNIVLVQRLLGHSSPDTTMLYVGWHGGEAGETVAAMYKQPA